MADTLALIVSLVALSVALRCLRRIATLAPAKPVVQSHCETLPEEPDHSKEWERFMASPEREQFERAVRSGTEVT